MADPASSLPDPVLSGQTGQVLSHPDDGHPAVLVQVALRWADMDAYGHVNNVQVARVLEEARIGAFGVPGGTGASGLAAPVPLLGEGMPEGTQALIAEHTVKYRKPLEYRTVPVQVWVWVSAVKGASVEIAYSVRDGVEGTECVSATTTMVFADPSTGRPVRLTDQQRAALAALQG